MPEKLIIKDIRKEFIKENYTLLTEEYKNQFQRLDYICPNGHKRSTTWKNWKKGNRCLICKNHSTKPSIDLVRESFDKEGYILLSEKYLDNKTKLVYVCPKGHKNSITWSDWHNGGYRCPDCAGNKKLSIEQIRKDFDMEGYTLLSSKYLNNSAELVVKCPNGHKFKTFWNNWQRGRRCPLCYRDRINIDLVRKVFEGEGYELLSEVYVDARTKLDYICDKGHKHSISWAAWQQGERCYYCRNDANRVSIEDIKGIFYDEGYTFIESSYYDKKLKYICPKGHQGEVTIGNWKSGNRCPYCYGNAKLEFGYVKSEIETEGYKVVTTSKDYKNNRTKLHLVCPKGHDYYASWFDWNSNKVRCHKCKDKGTSLQEQEVIEYVKSCGIEVEVHDRYLIKPKELDILIPSKKIAIEYCGLYWHSELMGKDKNYHLNKLKLCKEKGYQLITIFEDEWVNKEAIVKNRLKHILHNTSARVVYARKCQIEVISAQQASLFCNKHHTQGYTGSIVKLGAFFEKTLVSVMTFAKPSLSKGAKNIKGSIFELSRFCSDSKFRVIGVASKLLAFFKRNYVWSKIFSYADRRWSSGDVYKQTGFEFDSITPVNYWYFLNGDIKRRHRFAFRKRPDEPKNKTEWEIRKNQGWNRIWDCGSLKYVMCNN